MAKRLNDASSNVIEENHLKENPEGFKDESVIVLTKPGQPIPEHKRVVFINQRDPGHTLHFHYASKTIPLHQYHLLDGYEYTLPVEVISHLESCAERIYGYRKGLDGNPAIYVKAFKYNFSFRQPRAA